MIPMTCGVVDAALVMNVAKLSLGNGAGMVCCTVPPAPVTAAVNDFCMSWPNA